MELFPHKTEEQQGMDSKPCASYQGNCQEVDDISCRTVLPAVQVSNVRRVTSVRDMERESARFDIQYEAHLSFLLFIAQLHQQGER